jgi:diguanylate cyclase (GGDEF)-like protein/PAS domain S-box-containing protein
VGRDRDGGVAATFGGEAVEAVLLAAIDGAAIGIAVLDGEHRIVSWNAAFAGVVELAGCVAEPCSHDSLLHPDDRLRVRRALDHVAATGSFATISARYGSGDAEAQAVSILASAVAGPAGVGDPGGGSGGWLLQVLPGAVVPTSDEVFRQVFERAPVAEATIALDSTFMHVNAKACELLGYQEHEVLGIPFPRFVDESSLPAATEVFAALLSGSSRTAQIDVEVVRKDGTILHTESYVSTVLDDTGAPLYFFVLVQDVTERRRRQREIWHQAVHDALTELPNRAWFLERLGQAVARGRREQNRLAVFFVDLDGFKEVNDTLGHEAGDQLLFAAAGRMSRVLRPGDTLARYGGDEFTVLCEDIPGRTEVSEIAERILTALREPFIVAGGKASIAASIGVALADAGSHATSTLVETADAAMYSSKQSGGGTYRITEL